MKVLIVGLNPSRKGGSSPSLKKLYEWLDYLDLNIVSFTNLYEGYEISKSQSQIDTIRDFSKEYDKVIALGNEAGRALLGVGVNCCILPHPSGLNRKLNDKKYVHQRLDTCKNYLRGADEIL